MASHVARQTLPCHASDLGADHLNGAHQRKRQQQGPSHGIAKLRSRLRVRGYAAWVVVRGSRYEARPHDVGQLRPIRPFDFVLWCGCFAHNQPICARETPRAIALPSGPLRHRLRAIDLACVSIPEPAHISGRKCCSRFAWREDTVPHQRGPKCSGRSNDEVECVGWSV